MIITLFLSTILSINSIYTTTRKQTSFEASEYISENFDSRLSRSQIQDKASVTIFTHGMGCNEKSWLPLDNDVLLTQTLPYKVSDQIYILSHNGDLQKYGSQDDSLDIDLNKHISLVYKGRYDAETYISNEDLYSDFEIALDSFLNILLQETNSMPKINLIGHSRGGIINLLYAIDHPQIIDNVFSIGTPYQGSDWGKMIDAIYSIGHTNDNYKSPYHDFADENAIASYMSDWNNAFYDYHLRAYPVMCVQTERFLIDSLNYSIGQEGSQYPVIASALLRVISNRNDLFGSFSDNEILGFISNLLSAIIDYKTNQLNPVFTSVEQIVTYFLSFFSVSEALSDLHTAISSFLSIVDNDFYVDNAGNARFLNDCCVNYNSQKGLPRNNDHNNSFSLLSAYEMVFDDYPANPGLALNNYFKVAHNLETKNEYIHTHILSTLGLNNSLHSHVFSMDFDQDEHYLLCNCGALYLNHAHEISYAGSTDDYEHISCQCGYHEDTVHNYTYTLTTTTTHQKTCTRCNRIVNGNHSFRYKMYSTTQHKGTCACGRTKYENHSFNASGLCGICKYKRGGISGPIQN